MREAGPTPGHLSCARKKRKPPVSSPIAAAGAVIVAADTGAGAGDIHHNAARILGCRAAVQIDEVDEHQAV
jgi:hypothetical protein